MIGMQITFTKQVMSELDAMNNPVTYELDISVDNVLVAPIIEPAPTREQQAMYQQRDQVRIHLPKTFDGDISGSTFVYDNKVFRVDSDSVVFMKPNTPTQWNRYFKAEFVRNYAGESDWLVDGYITEDSEYLFVDESDYYYFAQEVI